MINGMWSYDTIAELYGDDMGANMPFDDVSWYLDRAKRASGHVLEIGCGTGRILLPVLAAGISATGIDRSMPMLRELSRAAREQYLHAPIIQMDLRELGVRSSFQLAMLPYSLITYITEPARAAACLARLREHLDVGGQLLLDAFIPRPTNSFNQPQLDYRRPYQEGFLERRKRITTNYDGTHRIEREYRLLDHDDALQRSIRTDETIRPYSFDQLKNMAHAGGFIVQECILDYAQSTLHKDAQFVTLVLGKS